MSKQGDFLESRRLVWPIVGCAIARLGLAADIGDFETPRFVCRADQLNAVACRLRVILDNRPG